MKAFLVGLIISVTGVVGVLPVPTHAQDASANVQLGPEQKTGTSTTESEKITKKIGPRGEVIEEKERTKKTENLHGEYKYSGLPCKWIRK
jgi:hypothetical protein